MGIDLDTGDDTWEAWAENVHTHERRQVEIFMSVLEEITLDQEFDTCTGTCACYPLEQDGVCQFGWPSHSRVAGIV